MRNKNEEKKLTTSERLNRQIHLAGSAHRAMFQNIKGSVRELEFMASRLRETGDSRVADSIDIEIVELLERKICKKIVNRSRKEQKLLQMGSA